MSTNAGYERSDAQLKPLVLFAIALAVLVSVALWLVSAMESGFERAYAGKSEAHPLEELRERPAGPALQSDPTMEIDEHARWESDLLGEYRWIDRENGVVSIPIERAMSLTIERGLPRAGSEEDGR